VRRHAATARHDHPAPLLWAQARDRLLSPAEIRDQWHALQEAQLEIEVSRQYYADLYDLAPVGFLTLDLNGCICDVNLSGAGLMGRKRSRLIGTPLLPLIHQPDRRKYLSYLTRLRRGQVQASTEVAILNRDGTRISVQLVSMSGGQDRARIHTAMVDITERKLAEEALRQAHDELERRVLERTAELTRTNAALQAEIGAHKEAENELRESKARLRAILDNSPTIVFIKDTEGRYLHCNRQFGQTFHLRLEQVIGKTDAQVFPSRFANAYHANDLKVLEAGVPMQFDEISVHDDGPHTSIVTKFPLYDLDGKIYALAGIVTDITERRRLEAEVLRISEREHQRIAQDLHDGLGQQLAGLWCLSNVLQKNLEAQNSPEVSSAAKICKLLRTAVTQTRSLARGLYPVPPEPNGLQSALEELAAQVSDLFTVSCKFVRRRPVLLEDKTVATHLYRIAQEAVTNGIKHGRARRIRITLSSTKAGVTLAVADDGIRFKKTARLPKGIGLRIMNYRADVIGAALVVGPGIGRGTEVICTVPVAGSHKPSIGHGQTRAKPERTQKNLHRR